MRLIYDVRDLPMQWTDRYRSIRNILILAAILIAAVSLVFSHYLLRDMQRDVSSKMNIWAEAMRTLNTADENTDLNLVLKVINDNTTIPVIVLNEKGDVLQFRNLKFRYTTPEDSIDYLRNKVHEMRSQGHSIKIYYTEPSYSLQSHKVKDEYLEIVYEDSLTLKRLAIYPYLQIAILAIFILILIFALLSLKRAEQNRVWVGLTKETAHQLGTPISSLIAWQEILKDNHPNDAIIPEMGKDIERLKLIAERFSKVGSRPELKEEDLKEIIWHVVDYISMRLSSKVKIICSLPATPVKVKLSAPLFEWVVENLCKNAIDAMQGKGQITITAHEITGLVIIDVADTGKGIAKNHWKSVFMPGYTTKERGWGLGLSLAKRIIEEYHHGRIYVRNSEIGRGTTFRIELRVKN